MKIFVLFMAFVSALATNAASSESELVTALKTTNSETFQSGKYYENVAQYEVWQKGEFLEWKRKWESLNVKIDQFLTSKSGKDKDIAKNTVELLKLQIKLFDGQNINNPAAFDSLSSVATESRAIQSQLQSLKFYLPGKKDSQSLLIEFAKALESAATKSASSALIAAIRSTHSETFGLPRYYNSSGYEQWLESEFPKWKTKWGLLTKDIDQFIASTSGKDKDMARTTVELLKLQIKLFDGQNLKNNAALDSLSMVAAAAGETEKLLNRGGKEDSKSLLKAFAQVLKDAAMKSRSQLELLPKNKEDLASFKNTIKERAIRKIDLICANLKTNTINQDAVSRSEIDSLKKIMKDENIPFLESDQKIVLCSKYLGKRAGKMPVTAYANEIISKEASARTQEDKAISDEQNYLKRKKRLLKVEKLGEALPNASCSTRIVGDSPYAVKTDETLSANKIDLAPRLYEKLIEASVTENITSPLIELTAENNRKILVRYQPNSNLREGFAISSATSKLLNNASKVKAKWCLGIPTARKLHFIAFDAENIEDVKTKVHAQLESALENYAGLTLGLKLVVQVEERAVTLVIEKIEDSEGNKVSAVQIPVALEADFEVRTEVEAFDAENNLIPITDEIN